MVQHIFYRFFLSICPVVFPYDWKNEREFRKMTSPKNKIQDFFFFSSIKLPNETFRLEFLPEDSVSIKKDKMNIIANTLCPPLSTLSSWKNID